LKISATLWHGIVLLVTHSSAYARISKGQGYQGKGQGAVLAKKGQFATYKEKLEKCFPLSFNTFKTL
jgi:hypothetical protein